MNKQIGYNQLRPAPSYAQSRANRRPRREYAYAPGAFTRTDLSSNREYQRSTELQQGRSLVTSREVAQTLGFPGRVLAAVNVNRETFWVVDVRDAVTRTLPGRYSLSKDARYEVAHPNGSTVNLGETGIAVVHPRTWVRGDADKPGFRALYNNADHPHTWTAVVSGNRQNTKLNTGAVHGPAREALDLPDNFPDGGFIVSVAGIDPYNPRSTRVEIGMLGGGSNADQGEVSAVVLEPLPRTVNGMVAQALGNMAMPGIK